jgi:hypothetical protein
MTIPREEIYAPRLLFTELGGFTSTDLSAFLQRNGISAHAEGIPIFRTIAALNAERKKKQFGSASQDVDAELKKEKILKERIANQERLRVLIPNARAKERMRDTLQRVQNMVRYAIKQAAPRVAACIVVRDCENILIETYNAAIDELEQSSTLMDWEDETTHYKSRRTELAEDTEASISSGSSDEDAIAA